MHVPVCGTEALARDGLEELVAMVCELDGIEL